MVSNKEELTKYAAWDMLLDIGISEEALNLVTCINGFTLEILEEVLYVYTGYRDFSEFI